MTEHSIFTIAPGAMIPYGFFDKDNITFIQHKISEVLSREFEQEVIIDRASIVRIMQRVLQERQEIIPKMNRRTIMYICDEFRNHQYQLNKRLNWEANYASTQKPIDVASGISRFDNLAIKTTDRKKYDGKTRVGGTLRFYFT